MNSSDYTTDRYGRFVPKSSLLRYRILYSVRRWINQWSFVLVMSVLLFVRGISKRRIRKYLERLGE